MPVRTSSPACVSVRDPRDALEPFPLLAVVKCLPGRRPSLTLFGNTPTQTQSSDLSQDKKN